MKCPDCRAEMLTYSQHLSAGCEAHADRILAGRETAPRPKCKRPPAEPVNALQPPKRRAAPTASAALKICAVPGCTNTRTASNAYCNQHKAQKAKIRAAKRGRAVVDYGKAHEGAKVWQK